MTTAAEKRTEQAEAIARLREWIAPGDTLYTVMRHRSASGMSRSIDVYGFGPVRDGDNPPDARNLRIVKSWYSYNIAKAGIGAWDDKHEAIRIGGAGMDMGFHIVYNLGRVLFPDGFGCVGTGCQSSEHINGDRDYTPHHDATGAAGFCAACNTYFGKTCPGADHWHRDGGYALRHEWIG